MLELVRISPSSCKQEEVPAIAGTPSYSGFCLVFWNEASDAKKGKTGSAECDVTVLTFNTQIKAVPNAQNTQIKPLKIHRLGDSFCLASHRWTISSEEPNGL